MAKLTIDLDIPIVEKILNLGVNDETAVRVREYVIAEILRRYSKEVFGNEQVKKVIAQMEKDGAATIKKYCETELKNYVTVGKNYNGDTFALNTRVKEQIRDEVVREYHGQIRDLCKSVFDAKAAEFEKNMLETAEELFNSQYKPRAERHLKELAAKLSAQLISETSI